MSLEAGHRWRAGGCHCGIVRFEAAAPETIEVEDCNCSICAKSGYLHMIVPKSRFRLLAGGDKLTPYRFGTGAAEHLFCSVCGVKSFYIPRSNPDGISVNLRCLDQPMDFGRVDIVAFDGRNNWDAQAALLAAKSRD